MDGVGWTGLDFFEQKGAKFAKDGVVFLRTEGNEGSEERGSEMRLGF